MNAEETKRWKAKQLRYKKPIVRDLNLDKIQEGLWNIMEECENIRWYTDSDDGNDSLINALDGDEDEAKKKMKTITKDELIAAARQCFKVYQSYIGLRNRYDSLKAAIDILRDQNTGFLQTIKEIERLYEAASKEQGITAKYSTEWKEFERYTDALPQEAWIQ